jgi:hypothetical protein
VPLATLKQNSILLIQHFKDNVSQPSAMALIWKNAVVENQPAKTIKMLTDQTPSLYS